MNVCTVLGICALSVGFTGKTGFTFKLLHGEKMSETVGYMELTRYVIQVIAICTYMSFFSSFSSIFDFKNVYNYFNVHF